MQKRKILDKGVFNNLTREEGQQAHTEEDGNMKEVQEECLSSLKDSQAEDFIERAGE